MMELIKDLLGSRREEKLDGAHYSSAVAIRVADRAD